MADLITLSGDVADQLLSTLATVADRVLDLEEAKFDEDKQQWALQALHALRSIRFEIEDAIEKADKVSP